VALVAAVLAGLVAAGLVYLRRPPRVSPPLSAGAQGTGAATADEGRLILDTLQRSNVLIWWAHVTREGTSFRWNIRTPPQLRDNPVYRLASPIDDRTLWRDDHAPDHERTRLTAESALAGGKRGYEQQFRIIGTDGVHWLNEEVVIRPAGQDKWDLEGVIADVTKHHEAEAIYRGIFENARIGIFATKPDGRILAVNPSMARIFGYESVESSMREVTSAQSGYVDLAERADLQRRLKESGRVVDFETKMVRRDGTHIPVRLNIHVVQDGPGEQHYEGTLEDVTERKHADALIREQNEILSKSHEGIVIVNMKGEIAFWNVGAGELFGWTAAEALGQAPEKLLGMDDLEALAAVRAAVDGKGFWTGEIRMRDRKGRNLTVEAHATLVRDEAGQPKARLNFLADITEKKLFEEKFLHAQRLDTIGMLAAGIAHDLNNVLAPIMFAAPLLRDALSTPRDLKILDTVNKSAARGAGLVKQILGFAHSTASELQPTQVKHIARDIIGVITETFPKSIELEQKVPSDLWPVMGNATQIHQVLLNLCVNARDAMPQGGTLHITAANRRLNAAEATKIPGARPGPWLVFEVGDTGTGITPEVLERIWTPFFTTKGTGKGTGLGLSTVRGIVANHKGFVQLDTVVGRGTTFRVFLPAVESEAAQAASASPFDIPDGHGELILVVDDDTGFRHIGTAILEKHGYRVLSCADGVEAIILFISRAPDISLVITDVDMPRLGGTELARALPQLRPDIPIIAMSGLAPDAADGSGALEAQQATHAFLLKPIKATDLLGAVHRLLHQSGRPGGAWSASDSFQI